MTGSPAVKGAEVGTETATTAVADLPLMTDTDEEVGVGAMIVVIGVPIELGVTAVVEVGIVGEVKGDTKVLPESLGDLRGR